MSIFAKSFFRFCQWDFARSEERQKKINNQKSPVLYEKIYHTITAHGDRFAGKRPTTRHHPKCLR